MTRSHTVRPDFESPEAAEETIKRFAGKRVLVMGDLMLDEYLLGEASRLSPEAPVPVVRVGAVKQVLGGAGNTAANIVSLGGRVTLLAVGTDDEAGRTLSRLASQAGIDYRPVDCGLPTLRKTRVIGQRQQIVRLDYETVRPLSAEGRTSLLGAIDRHLPDADIVVISDYAKGFMSVELAREILARLRQVGCPSVVDPRPENRECYAGFDYLTPNWREGRALLGLPDVDPSAENVRATARALASAFSTNVVLTLGPHGIYFCARDVAEEWSLPTAAREVFDVSGAGDTVVATFALGRAAGLGHDVSVGLANRAAGIVVGKFGTATVAAAELISGPMDRRILTRADLAPLASGLRSKGRRIATVNGSFDLLHSGHLHILREAKACGDVLIVGLNSDQSIRTYKGPDRPLVPQDQRAEMLLAIRMVDYVHVFDESDPRMFLAEVLPDVHVNGVEYGEECIEKGVVERGGGRIHLVGRVGRHSTSAIVERIRAEQGRSPK